MRKVYSIGFFVFVVLLSTLIVVQGAQADVQLPMVTTAKKLLASYAAEKNPFVRTQLALKIIPLSRKIILSGNLSDLDAREQKSMANAGQFYAWVRGRVYGTASALTGDERVFLGKGVDGSLVPYGAPIFPKSRAQCTTESLLKVKSLFSAHQNVEEVMARFRDLMAIDQKLNRRHYHQQLARIVEGQDETPYKAIILQYLNDQGEVMYQDLPESKKNADSLQKAFYERQRLLMDLIRFGVERPKSFFAKIMSVSKGCAFPG